MKKILILISIFWLAACTPTVPEDGEATPTLAVETATTAAPTPTLANGATATAVPVITDSPTETPIPPPPTSTLIPATVTAETPPTRIQFEPGATSITINGHLNANESVAYLAGAFAGQRMHVEVTSTNQAANFAITGMTDGQPYKRLVNEDRFWEGILPLSQDYLIRVTALEAVDFTLIVTIDPLEETVLQPVWPIVDGTSGFLIGGSHNGQWLDALTVMPSLQDGERPYQLYTGTQILGQITGTTPFAPDFGPCVSSPQVGFPAASDLSETIALVSSWNATPRQTEPLPLDTPVYQEAVALYLQANGIAEPEVQITRIDKIDIEGDGVYEVVISAARLTGLGNGLPTAAAGDYSVVLLRKIVNGTLTTFTIAEALFPEAVELADPAQFNILAFLDLNGNGTLEIVLESFYYEGRFISVHEITNQGANRVLTAGCRL